MDSVVVDKNGVVIKKNGEDVLRIDEKGVVIKWIMRRKKINSYPLSVFGKYVLPMSYVITNTDNGSYFLMRCN
jgi:hypothetical protein